MPEASGSGRDTASPKPEGGGFNISNDEVIRRLRSKGQPIRLFGETDRERRLRLRALELIEGRGHDKLGGQNDFKKALEDVETNELEAKAKGREKNVKSKDDADASGTTLLDLDLVKTNPDKLYPIIYYALKKVLKEWGESMDERPDHIKRSTQGKLAAATQVQSAQYLKPLFKQLRTRVCFLALFMAVGLTYHEFRIFLPMCSHEWRKLCITCRSASTRELMTRIFVFPSEMHRGLLE